MASKTTYYEIDVPEYVDFADIEVLGSALYTIDRILYSKLDNPPGGIAGKFLQIGVNGTPMWGAAASPTAVAAAASEWLADHVSQGITLAIDDSLTISGYAADAKVVGDKINNIGVTDDNHGNVTLVI